MTLLDIRLKSEIKNQGWNYNTLKPPLKLKDIIHDIYEKWKSYCRSDLIYMKKFKFLFLYFFQRLSYNLGWFLSSKKYAKSLRGGAI